MEERDALLIALAEHVLNSYPWAHAPKMPLDKALEAFREAATAAVERRLERAK